MHRCRAFVAVLLVAVLLAAGFGVGACRVGEPTRPDLDFARLGVEQVSGAYCRVVVRGAPAEPAAPSPASLREHWDERLAYERRALFAAPVGLALDWALVAAFTHDDLTPAIDALGYTTVPDLHEPLAVTQARARIGVVDAGCRGDPRR